MQVLTIAAASMTGKTTMRRFIVPPRYAGSTQAPYGLLARQVNLSDPGSRREGTSPSSVSFGN
jgi:hypothetical protein